MKGIETIVSRKKLLMIGMVALIVVAVITSMGKDAFGKCEAALARLKQAEADLDAANKAFNAANNAAKKAQAKLAAAVANLNAVAGKLGAQGKATSDSATFGRSPTGPAFFDNPEYKAAKQAWQDAKEANQKAEGDLDQAGMARKRAQDERDDAQKEYDKLRAEHIGDAGFVRAPAPLKVDEGLTEKVEELVMPNRWHKIVKENDVDLNISYDLKKVADKSLLEVSIISTGKGASYRKWLPRKPKLVIGQDVIDPIETHDYFVTKASPGPLAAKRASGVSPHLISAIGSQYSSPASKTTHASCPTEPAAKSSSVGGTLGRAGIATGIGLMTSQPKTQTPLAKIKGLKATFDITGHEEELKRAELKANIVNESEHTEIDVALPAGN